MYFDDKRIWVKARISERVSDKEVNGKFKAEVSHLCIPAAGNDFHSDGALLGDDLKSVEFKLFKIFLREFLDCKQVKLNTGY